MDKRSKIIAVLVAAILITTLANPPKLAMAQANSWTPWDCKWAVWHYPVTGGVLDGRACASWWTGATLQWQVWADTFVPYSNTIHTYVQGEDRCTGFGWVLQMWGARYVYYDDYGTSGPGAVGSYQNCTSGHQYRAYYAGSRKQYSWSSWQGTSSYVYW
jgi:hypothetical protein